MLVSPYQVPSRWREKFPQFSFGAVQQTEDRSARPVGEIRNLLRGVAFDDCQIESLALVNAQNGERAIEHFRLEDIRQLFQPVIVVPHGSVVPAIERNEIDTPASSVLVDEAIPKSREHIRLVPGPACAEDGHARFAADAENTRSRCENGSSLSRATPTKRSPSSSMRSARECMQRCNA